MIPEKIKKSNINYPSTLRHSLGYLPTILLKAIIEDKILDKKENEKEVKFPKTFSFHTSSLFIDISHCFDRKKANVEVSIENNDNNANKKNKSKKRKQNDLDDIMSPEFFYFCINRYYENLISIIGNNGGDVIFQGNGIYAIWPPDKKELDSNNSSKSEDDENIDDEKKLFFCLKAIQCALEIKKNSIAEIKEGCSFTSSIGCGFGECKFIVFKGIKGKHNYIVLGDALTTSCECSKHDSTGGQIIVGSKIINLIKDYFQLKEFYIDGIKFSSILEAKNKDIQIKNIKANVNVIKNNFTLEQIALNNHKYSKFCHEIIYNIFQRNIFDEKWIKEIKNVTLLFMRLKMNQKDLDDPNKLQEIYIILQKVAYKNGGNLHKISTDNKGILVILTFGILSSSSGFNELKGVLSSIELNVKMKQKNVYPFIGVTSGDLFCGLCGTIGNRREFSVLGSAYLNALSAVEKAEVMYGDKKSGNDNILIDENTVLMIDSKIPVKFWEKNISYLGMDLNLFIPMKISNLVHLHSEANLFPLIGCHLNSTKSEEYQLDEDFIEEEYIIYLEEKILQDYVQTLNDFAGKKSKIKLINISGPTGCGKTMLLQKSLKTFFQMNPKLREILCNTNYGDDYPFIFSSNLIFTIGNTVLLENEIKEYRGMQLIIKDIFTILYNDDYYKKNLVNLFQNKDMIKFLGLFQKIVKIPELMNLFEGIEFVVQEDKIKKEMLPKINSFIYDLLYEYKKFLLSIYEEKLSKYNLDIPLIILIDDYNICDQNTKDFIRYYLKKEQNPFLIITANTFQIFPYYNFLSKKEKDAFYDYNDENIVKKYILTPYYTKEKIVAFCISILFELRKASVNSVSSTLITFLLNKTYHGIPQFIKELILSLYDNNLIYITKNDKELVEGVNLKKMIYYNDFTELNIPDIIHKKVGAIIDNYLDKIDIYILKIASIIGDKFDLTKLKQAVLIDNSSNDSMSIIKDKGDNFLYDQLCSLEEKNIIEILYDLEFKKKYVVCKFSVPFLREVLYQRTPSEYRNQIHYIIGKLVKFSTYTKSQQKIRYNEEVMDLGILEKHLKYSQISIHDNFLNGKLSTTKLENDNYLNINNLKTLIIRQICVKIKSIKINDDKNNMIKAGYVNKKSDGKLTWENRYFVLTTNKVLYFYTEKDYMERKAPLGAFYLQNLFNVKLLTDGSVGGKKNIIALIVNEWFKKGEVMKSRTYYLSVEEREESFKWVITLNILKIKAFYENYCFSFGYLNFPLYETNGNEFLRKQKKIKFSIPIQNTKQSNRQNMKRQSIYSPYLSLGRNENRLYAIEYENFIIKQLLLYFKFILLHSFPIFLGGIQLGLSKESYEYEDSKIYCNNKNEQIELKNPSFYENLIEQEEKDEKKVKQSIEIINKKYKDKKQNNTIYLMNKNEYTENQLEYFKKYYKKKKNYIKIDIIDSFKKLQDVISEKYVRSGGVNNKNKINYLFFKNSEEPHVDKEDYLNYIEYTDNDGKLKEKYRDSGSLSKSSNNSTSKIKRVKDDLYSKRESMIETDENTGINNNVENQNNNKNSCPVLSTLKQNTERKKKLLHNELENDRRVSKTGEGSSEMSSSKGDSLNDSLTMKDDKKKNQLVLPKLKELKELKESKENKSDSYSDSDSGSESDSFSDSEKMKKKAKKSNKKKVNESNNKNTKKNENKKNNNEKNNRKKSEENKLNNSIESIKSKQNIFSKLSLGPSNNNEEIKFIADIATIKNLSLQRKSTRKSNSHEEKDIEKGKDNNKERGKDKNESGKFAASEGEFKELLQKLIQDKKSKPKQENVVNKKDKVKNKDKDDKEVIKSLLITTEEKEKKSKNEKEVDSKNNAGCIVLTFNDENMKTDRTDENITSKEKEALFGMNVQKKEEKKTKKTEKEENKIGSSSSQKKEQNDLLHSSNDNKVVSLNTISTIDNNIESVKNNFTGSYYHSINKLLSDIGSRRGRRKSNITYSFYKNKNAYNINDMVSYSSSQSNLLYQRRNSNLQISRSNSTQNITINKSNLHNFIFMNNLKNINIIEKSNNKDISNNPSSQNSIGQDSLSLINKLKNLNVSLENERNFSSIFKTLNNKKKIINENNNYNHKKSPNSVFMHSRNVTNKKVNKFNPQEKNTTSTKSTSSNFYYPDVYYINNENNLHKKTHVSTVFSKLKAFQNRNNYI